MAYSDQERLLLERYFSNVERRDHADIYLVRNLPQEVAATLNGVYSRSRLSMRDNFLERLRKGLAAAGESFDDLPLTTAHSDRLAELMGARAGQFLKTYAIDHGHNSLREGSVVHLAVENVSQLVTRFIQRERRCSFEESSTRYISFSEEGHWRDPDVRDAGGEVWAAYEDILSTTFGLYRSTGDRLLEHLRRVRPLAEGEKEGPWLRALRAEAFDAARYLLTPAIYTKWGLVADARTLSDIVSELLSHPLAEFQEVGKRMQQEAEGALPTLLAHAGRRPYLAEQHTLHRELAASFRSAGTVRGTGQPSLSLLAFDAELDDRLLASMLYEHADIGYQEVLQRCKAMTPADRQQTMQRLLQGRSAHDTLPAGLEGAAPFDFEVLVDFGAYRDIGRHRKGFQQQQLLTVSHGYLVPPLMVEAGLDGEFQRVLDQVAAQQSRIAAHFPHAAGYVTPFAFLQRVRITFDPRQVGYFIELRSGPEGHFAYRQVAIDLFAAVERVSPLFATFIRAKVGAAFLGRMEAEQGADERRERRMLKAGDL